MRDERPNNENPKTDAFEIKASEEVEPSDRMKQGEKGRDQRISQLPPHYPSIAGIAERSKGVQGDIGELYSRSSVGCTIRQRFSE